MVADHSEAVEEVHQEEVHQEAVHPEAARRVEAQEVSLNPMGMTDTRRDEADEDPSEVHHPRQREADFSDHIPSEKTTTLTNAREEGGTRVVPDQGRRSCPALQRQSLTAERTPLRAFSTLSTPTLGTKKHLRKTSSNTCYSA
jgi:hypothetical protein